MMVPSTSQSLEVSFLVSEEGRLLKGPDVLLEKQNLSCLTVEMGSVESSRRNERKNYLTSDTRKKINYQDFARSRNNLKREGPGSGRLMPPRNP